jgi:flagellar biosynthetic protein FliR
MNAIDPGLLLHGYAIFLRAGAFLFLLPLLGRPVPVLVRAAGALFLAVFMVPLTDPAPELVMPGDFIGLALLGIREVFIGFVMGYSVQVIFYLCSISGRLMSMEIGLMQSKLFNPLMADQQTVLATGMTTLSTVLIFTLDIHHLIIFAFKRSLELMPAGTADLGSAGSSYVVQSVGNIFLLSVQMSAPLIAVNFIVTLSFAILGRAVPNLNILILSFGVRILAGFFVLILVFVVVVQFLLGVINGTPERMLQFLPLP